MKTRAAFLLVGILAAICFVQQIEIGNLKDRMDAAESNIEINTSACSTLSEQMENKAFMNEMQNSFDQMLAQEVNELKEQLNL